MRRVVVRLAVLAALFIGVGLFVTRPQTANPADFQGLVADPANGALVFAAMGCASCHMGEDEGSPDLLPGGRRFSSDFGTFIAPNISPDPNHGIGNWTDIDIANAVLHGTSPNGQHYYPAFPFTSYARATPQDITDLIAHLRSLPPQAEPSLAHEVGFPFNIRVSLGGWKLLFGGSDWVITGDLSGQQERGRYLVEALGHCSECHTPRNALGGPIRSAWLSGAPNPSGKGNIPGITKDQLEWSDADVAAYLTTGFTPDFDSAGGSMVEVIENISKLPKEDVDAIVAYLRLVPSP